MAMRTKNRRRRRRQTAYYVFTRPNQMKGHKFTDDVALCKAQSVTEAIKEFSKLYKDVKPNEVHKLTTGKDRWGFNPNSPYRNLWILTDY